ncbi:alginate biosynthesis protein AlgP [Deinococcus depolymerans]|uniref:Alginate biosynthesis protein AlgP n=1 Tax=Deinococcus depolymerans TaxID=392408 RepID=A0ABN1C4F8_9DEIO
MTSDMTGGVSKRSLLMLGGLAALALNKDTRRALVTGSRDVWSGAQHTLQDTVKPTMAHSLALAQERSQELALEAARRGSSAAQTLREEGVPRAASLLGSVVDEVVSVAGGLAGTAGDLAGGLSEGAQQVTRQGSRRAGQLLSAAHRGVGPTLADAQGAGLELLSTVHDRVSSTLHEAADGAQTRQRRLERTLRQARRDAEKDLLSGGRRLKPAQLQRAVDRRVAPLQKNLTRELKVLERQARQARRDDRGGAPGGLVALAVIGTGAVVLARVPAARQGILNAVESVNPDAAQALRQAGRNARNLIGTAWLERIEENKATPAPGAAKSTQAATTGASAYGAVAPDSPAAARTAAEESAKQTGGAASQEGKKG